MTRQHDGQQHIYELQSTTRSTLPATKRRRSAGASQATPAMRQLREALAAYGLDSLDLRHLVSLGADLRTLIRALDMPEELIHLLTLMHELLTPTERTPIRSPADCAARFLALMSHLEQEQLWVVCLNTKNRVQQARMIYQGSLQTSLVRISELFRPAIALNSAAIIVSHNHPSGDPSPSSEDILLTREIRQAGKTLDIDLLDHLIIGQGKWISLREKGLGFDKN
jgi:DNA repair protein RadC